MGMPCLEFFLPTERTTQSSVLGVATDFVSVQTARRWNRQPFHPDVYVFSSLRTDSFPIPYFALSAYAKLVLQINGTKNHVIMCSFLRRCAPTDLIFGWQCQGGIAIQKDKVWVRTHVQNYYAKYGAVHKVVGLPYGKGSKSQLLSDAAVRKVVGLPYGKGSKS